MKVLKILLVSCCLFLLFYSCAEKQKEVILPVPEDFIAFLDYHSAENEKDFGTVVVVSKSIKGKVELNNKGKKEELEIKPGEIKRFSQKIKLIKGDKVTLKHKKIIKDIPVKYEKYLALPLGGVETKSAMFSDNTFFYATKAKQNYITVYHIAKTKETSFGFPDKDTVWFAIAFKNRIKISDTEGIFILKKFSGKNKEIYYVTTYYYDTDYNFVGGFPGWEARYIQQAK